MPDFKKTYDSVILGHEGGYVASPETYRGIDKAQQPGWEGWSVIENYKAKYGVPKWRSTIPIPTLETMVRNFYQNVYLKPVIGIYNNIGSQTIADMFIDFYVHKPYYSLSFLKAIVGQLSPQTNNLTETINANAQNFYTLFRNLRIDFYQNPKKYGYNKTISEALVNRAKSFPVVLPDVVNPWQSFTDAWKNFFPR